jgi:hypothetical protein
VPVDRDVMGSTVVCDRSHQTSEAIAAANGNALNGIPSVMYKTVRLIVPMSAFGSDTAQVPCRLDAGASMR